MNILELIKKIKATKDIENIKDILAYGELGENIIILIDNTEIYFNEIEKKLIQTGYNVDRLYNDKQMKEEAYDILTRRNIETQNINNQWIK